MKYFEDMVVGDSAVSEADYLLEEEEIKSFCQKWDPMPFHIDDEAAAASIVGKLFTSALHSLSIANRLGHTMLSEETATLAGLGWEDVRFRAPACVGDRLRLRGEIIAKRELSSRPDRGIVTSRVELFNQDDAVVVSYETKALMRKRGA